jgi:hypothetical protein
VKEEQNELRKKISSLRHKTGHLMSECSRFEFYKVKAFGFQSLTASFVIKT